MTRCGRCNAFVFLPKCSSCGAETSVRLGVDKSRKVVEDILNKGRVEQDQSRREFIDELLDLAKKGEKR